MVYIKGRYIGHNVRIIEDMMTYTSEQKISGLLVLIDFQKAFDTVEWDFLFETLKSYNFGPTFRSWIQLLYNDISSCTINNGYFSNNFKLSRGIRQGCPISALLFILVAEVLSLRLKSDESAKGICIDGFTYKVIQLADDTTIFMKDLRSLKAAIQTFLDFEKVAGLKINLEKCEIIELGPIKLNRLSMYKELENIKVNRGPFKTLGIWFSRNKREGTNLNFEGRMQNIKTTLQIWRQRNLSWKGRVMIIKTLILSQVTHLLGMIFTPNSFLEELDKLIFNFLWNNKPPRIKRETIIATVKDGGLRMPDIYAFHIAQKVLGMKNLILEEGKCLNLFLATSGVQKHTLEYKLNCKYIKNFKGDQFHEQILQCWFNINSNTPEDINGVLNEYVFMNRYIIINNAPIYPEDYGIDQSLRSLRIVDIVDADHNFLSLEALKQKLNTNFLNIHSIINAIPKNWKLKLKPVQGSFRRITNASIWLNKVVVPLNKVTSNKIYWEIVNHKIKPATAKYTWCDLFPFLEHIDWKKIYRLVYIISSEPYLQTFQYKILNRTINCRYNLWRWNIIPDGKCLYCSEIDTIEHHFYYCFVSKQFWNEVLKWFQRKTNFTIALSVCEVLFGAINDCYGDSEIINALNFIILISKWFINTSRSLEKELLLSQFLSLVKEKLCILKMNQSLNNNLESFNKLYGRLEGN